MAKSLYAAKFAFNNDITNPLSVITSIFCRFSVGDRFGILNDNLQFNFKAYNPNLSIFNQITSDNLGDIALNVAKDFIKNNPNKKFVVFWSGGVDSTTVITAFILAGIEVDRLIIVYTDNSIVENHKMYLFLKERGYYLYRFTWENTAKVIESFKGCVFFTGWCADQLFGSEVNQRYPEFYFKPWKEGVMGIISSIYRSSDFSLKTVFEGFDLFDFYFKTLGVDIKYSCDFIWFFNFAFKWSLISQDFKLSIRDPEIRDNAYNFFEDERFQIWALSNYKTFVNHNQATEPTFYKKPFKDFIYSLNKDEDYLINKGKVNSWKSFDYSSHLQFTDLAIFDEDGYHYFDLLEDTPLSKNSDNPFLKQEMNRIFYLKDYLKDEDQLSKMMNFYSPQYRKFVLKFEDFSNMI